MMKNVQAEKDKKTFAKIEEIADLANIRGKIKTKHSILFTRENKEYAIIINKIVPNIIARTSYYAIRLVNYEKLKGGIRIKAVKRFPDLMKFYQTKEESVIEARNVQNDQELINQCVHEIETQEDDVENILLLGRTGTGKSALANVISGTTKFMESSGSISKTKEFQSYDFSQEETTYRIVDTVGIADTNFSKEKVLYKLGEAIYTMKGGIKQVFMVIGGRFTDSDAVETFKLATAFFGDDITNYVTIVRTKFKDFRILDKCEEDRMSLMDENRNIFRMIDSCNSVIYVDNPQLDSDERKRKFDVEDRRDSREVLLKHLQTLQGKPPYKMKNWDETCVRIIDYMNVKRLNEIHEEPFITNTNTNDSSINSGIKQLSKGEIEGIEKKIAKEVGKKMEGQMQEIMETLNRLEDEGFGQTEFRARIQIPLLTDVKLYLRVQKSCCSII